MALRGDEKYVALNRRARHDYLIEDTLEGAKSKRYRHAARHLMEADALAPAIPDYAGFESHEAFQRRLKAQHARKSAFWACVAERTR